MWRDVTHGRLRVCSLSFMRPGSRHFSAYSFSGKNMRSLILKARAKGKEGIKAVHVLLQERTDFQDNS